MTDLRTAVPALFAVLLLAACVPPNIPAQQVQSSNPTVTYTYRGDQELIGANQNASLFCSQYRARARTLTISDNGGNGKSVVFECLATLPQTMAQAPYNPNMPYAYRTDQELLAATQSAETTCLSSGDMRAQSNVVTNADGSKYVTFQCLPRM